MMPRIFFSLLFVALGICTAVNGDKLLWQATLDGPASAFVANKNAVFVVTNTSVQAFAKASGELLWTTSAFPDGPWFATLLIAASDTTVFLYTEFQLTLFIDASTGQVAKQISSPVAASSMFLDGDLLVLVGFPSSAAAFSASNYTEVWKWTDTAFQMNIFSKPVISHGFLLLLGDITPNSTSKPVHIDGGDSSSSSSSGGGSDGPSPIPYLYILDLGTGASKKICNINYISQSSFSGLVGAASTSPLSLAVWNLQTGASVWNISLAAATPLLGLGILQTPSSLVVAQADLFLPVALTAYSLTSGSRQWSTNIVNASDVSAGMLAKDGNLIFTVTGSRNGHSAPELLKLSSSDGAAMAHVYGIPTSPSNQQLANEDGVFVLNLQGFTRVDGSSFNASQVLTLPGLTNIASFGQSGGYVVAAQESVFAFESS
jgi:outer membrane protein assembly factor BamB